MSRWAGGQGSRWVKWAVSFVVAAIALCIASLFMGHSDDRAWRRIQSTGVITFAVDASYPPFEAIDANGNFFGFDIDLAREIARRLGVQAEFENIAYDGLLGALISDRDDAAISALIEFPDRLNEVAYTRTYFNAGIVIVVRPEVVGREEQGAGGNYQLPITDPLKWAESKTLAVEYGSKADALVRQWMKRVEGIARLSSPSAAEAMAAVESGAADAALVDAVSAYDFLLGHPALTIAGPPVEDELYVIATARGSPILLRELNRVLDEMEADGTMAGLRGKWFGEAARDQIQNPQ